MSGTLRERTILFFFTKISTPFIILFGFYKLSKSDRLLNLKDGFKDHRHQDYHIQSDLEHIHRIITSYKKSKDHQLSDSQGFPVQGIWDEWISVNYRRLIDAIEAENELELSSIFENILS